MDVRRYCCASPDCFDSRFPCQSCKSKAKACSARASSSADCDWQHITIIMPHLLWPFFNNNWPLLNDLFRCATHTMLMHARKLGIEVGIFCARLTFG